MAAHVDIGRFALEQLRDAFTYGITPRKARVVDHTLLADPDQRSVISGTDQEVFEASVAISVAHEV